MPRQARMITEFLHVIVRGIGKQILFEDDSDKKYFISLLQRFKDDHKIILLAYCIMENHVHLLIRNPDSTISPFMQKIGICYANYYNKKYDRCGHLFQDRYKSEVITSQDYLLTAYRYILKNPEKAGICPANRYPWSSYSDYGKTNRITDTSLLATLIGNQENFKLFMEQDDSTECMEDVLPKKDDAWALEIIKETLQVSSGTVLQEMNRKKRDDALIKLKSKGLSTRQIERLTSINRGVILKAGKVVR